MREYNPTGYYDGSYSYSEGRTHASDNAKIVGQLIIDRFKSAGYTITKVALLGMLGNMAHESYCSSGQWQGNHVGATSLGYGLTQWTPSTKLTSWLTEQGYPQDSLQGQIERLVAFECILAPNTQWLYSKVGFSFLDYIQKTDMTIEESVVYFLRAYEQAGVSAESERISYANQFADYFNSPIEITTEKPSQPYIEDTDEPDMEIITEKENSLFDLIRKKGYNINVLNSKQQRYLKARTLKNRVKVKQYGKRKDITNRYGTQVSLKKPYYRISSVDERGFLVTSNGTKINPRTIDVDNLYYNDVTESETTYPDTSDFVSKIEEMANWYIQNVPTYQANSPYRGYYQCSLVNMEVGDDCTGFSYAVLVYAGIINPSEVTALASSDYIRGGAMLQYIEKGGMKCHDVASDTVFKTGDMLCVYIPNGRHHVEFVVGENSDGTYQTFGWGSVKTTYPSTQKATRTSLSGNFMVYYRKEN